MEVTIRMNGAQDEVEIDGHRFDRSTLDRHQRATMAGMIRDAIFKPVMTNQRPKKRRNRRRNKSA